MIHKNLNYCKHWVWKKKIRRQRTESRKHSFIALQLAQALASALLLDFVLVVNWLFFATDVRQPWWMYLPLQNVCARACTSVDLCRCGDLFQCAHELKANGWWPALFLGVFDHQQNSSLHQSCLLCVLISWKATTQLTIVIQFPNSHLIPAILNHTGPPGYYVYIFSCNRFAGVYLRMFFLCVLTATVWCCSSKCNGMRHIWAGQSSGRGAHVSRGWVWVQFG